jgi:hypothetical protein
MGLFDENDCSKKYPFGNEFQKGIGKKEILS